MGEECPFEPAAELVAAVKRYGRVTALDGVDLALKPGEVTALLGPNGAGKTTAVKLLLGLVRPSGGQARLFGRDPRSPAARIRAGALMQISKVPETLKVREHLDLFASYYPRPLPRGEVIAATGLEGLEDRLFGKLSGGQRQRLLLALAICGDPDLLFLDEPTVGLDVESRRALWSAIRRLASLGKTILLTTHYLEEADALSDRVAVLSRGRIVALGTPAEIKARAAARRIRCVARLTVAEARALPGVASARQDGAALEILTGAAEAVVGELLARDPGLAGLEVTGAGLEEAFLALTGGDLHAGGNAAGEPPAARGAA
jgi:ABC-2 type transport system ATP-binding protein